MHARFFVNFSTIDFTASISFHLIELLCIAVVQRSPLIGLSDETSI